MRIAETIKTAREALGITQEELAEKLDVSRQAVSKWELGASLPAKENLALLSEILQVPLSRENEEEASPAPDTRVFPWKPIALILGALLLAALLSAGLYFSLSSTKQPPENPEPQDAGPVQEEPAITGVYFFDEDGTPLNPNHGDGWYSFPTGQRVLMLVTFRQGAEIGVSGVSLFATPTGTETYDEREQLALQAVYDRDFVLFAPNFPEGTTHLEIRLECDDSHMVTEMLNVAVIPEEDLALIY